MRIRNRSSWDSGSGNVPTCSVGFWVAMTKKGSGRRRVSPSAVTWCSSIASSSALCVLGVARLISSARITWANTGPGWNLNAPLSRSYTDTPMISAGSMSLVNWMRWKSRPSVLARTCASVVLPTPGRSSMSRCPRASTQAKARRICDSLPRMIWLAASMTWPTGDWAPGGDWGLSSMPGLYGVGVGKTSVRGGPTQDYAMIRKQFYALL